MTDKGYEAGRGSLGNRPRTRITTGEGRVGVRREREIIQCRVSLESVGGEGEGVGYPACRQHGTGEGAAAFLLAVQEPERQGEGLRERQGSRAPLHRLLG